MAGVRWNERELHQLLSDRDGPVGRDLAAKGERVQREAQRLCPVSPEGSGGNPPGHLRDSIGSNVGHDEQGMFAEVGTSVSYALPVELGSRPHVIESHGDYPLRDRHGRAFGRKVNHPGSEAQPYLRPALDVLRND